MDWGTQPPRIGEVIELSEPDERRAIQSMKLIGVPLFQIEDLDDVKSLFFQTGAELNE